MYGGVGMKKEPGRVGKGGTDQGTDQVEPVVRLAAVKPAIPGQVSQPGEKDRPMRSSLTTGRAEEQRVKKNKLRQ